MASKGKEQTTESPQPEQPAQRLDITVPGGRYLVNGKLVNANGEPLAESPVSDASPTQVAGAGD